MRGPCLFLLCPVVEVFVYTSHIMSHRTWFGALDLSLLATCLCNSANQKTCLIVTEISKIRCCECVRELADIRSGMNVDSADRHRKHLRWPEKTPSATTRTSHLEATPKKTGQNSTSGNTILPPSVEHRLD